MTSGDHVQGGRSSSSGRLAEHLAPRVSPGTLDREWAAIEGRLDRRAAWRRPWVPLGAGGLVVAAAAALLLWLGGSEAPAPSLPVVASGARIAPASDAAAPSEVRLSEGSRVAVRPGAQVDVVRGSRERVRLALRRGRADFAVTRNPRRPFEVEAGPVLVTVVGTRFTVIRGDAPGGGESVRVAVQEGQVRVRRPDGTVALLGADQVLRVDLSPSEDIGPPEAAAPEPLADGPDAPVEEPGPNVGNSEPQAGADDQPRGSRSRGAGRRRSADGAADRLFAEAGRLRQGGRPAEAVARYENLVRQHPEDPRAALAAFEAGRLRMDRMGDAGGAARAFQRALALGAPAGVREDAMARLAQAFAGLGREERCLRARAAYLDAYPRGVHAAAVRRLTCE
ncbi:MAG TPA: FecR domain-containing protein [Polyangiaceae bacterium LLY-WYZ-14_1]|nr:FecR domain-containing protein [Polyangiaceae bacterium LLY-WYZ-14_1]